MSFVSKPTIALHCKRLASALTVMSLCLLLGACSNDDDKAPDTGATHSADSAVSDNTNDNTNANPTAVLSANPASVSPAPPALSIQTPARPASSADPALSSAAPAPLATPVIHTVD